MLRKALRFFAYFVGSIILILLSLFALFRFYWASNINDWRVDIQQIVQEQLHSQVSFDQLALQWSGLEPSLHLTDVNIQDEQGQSIGSIRTLQLRADWWRALSLDWRIAQMDLDHARLVIERNQRGQLIVAGIVLGDEDDNESPQFMDWEGIFAQGLDYLPRKISVRNSEILWRDQRQHPGDELVFTPFSLELNKHANQLDLQARLQHPETAQDYLSWSGHLNRQGVGKLQVKLADYDLSILRKWLNLPLIFQKAQVKEALVSLELKAFQLSTMQVSSMLHDFSLQALRGEHELAIRADAISVDFEAKQGLQAPYQFTLAASNFKFRATEFFNHELLFDGINTHVEYSQHGPEKRPKLSFSQLRARLPNGAFSAQGTWQADGKTDSGLVDIQAEIDFMSLVDLPKYLPNMIDAESLEWLEHAFQSGQIEQASLNIQGEVDHIPFGEYPDLGRFELRGQVRDAVLDYDSNQLASEKNRPVTVKYWPMVGAPLAQVEFIGDVIRVSAPQGYFREPYQGLLLNNVVVTVADIESNTQVRIVSQVKAGGDDIMQLYHQSPLQGIIHHALDESSLSGQFSGSIDLHIPISHAQDSTIQAPFDFSQVRFQYAPEHPWLNQAQGQMQITEKNVQFSAATAQLLGGQTQFSGAIGATGDVLSVSGELSDKGLREYLNLAALERLKGTTSYQAKIKFMGGEVVDIEGNSTLKGMALDFPELFNKTANESTPLKLVWSNIQATPSGPKSLLMLNYKNQAVQFLAERVRNSRRFFSKAVLALNQKPLMPKQGLSLMVSGGDWDVDEWLAITEEFNSPNSKSTAAVFPALSYVDFKMPLLRYHDLDFSNIQIQAARLGANQWSIVSRSADVQGVLKLKLDPKSGDITAIDGDYDYLNLNSSERDNVAKQTDGGTIDFPEINVRVKKLSWNKQAIGELLLQGNPLNKQEWDIRKLSISNEVGALYGTGRLMAKNDSSALDLRVNASALDMGKFLSYFGHHQVFKGGNGVINAHLTTPDILNINLDTLVAEWDGQIRNGALLSVHSNAVKALELISIQSLSRLTSNNKSPGGVSNSLAFDYMRGQFVLQNNQLSVRDFRLNGPLIAVVAMGDTNIKTKQLNFQVVAVPKIEMSGAAILSGIIVNPVVGVGAFLSQWLLSGPLNRALTARYHVTGNWDTPVLNDLELPSEEELKDKNIQRKIDNLYRN